LSALVSSLWGALGGRAEQLGRVRVSDRGAWLGGALAVDELALGAVSSALLAAGELARARGGEAPEIELSAEHVALSFHSERHVLLDGRPAGGGFAPLSRFIRCADGGWARTHGNYPHHAAALARALGLDVELRGEHALRALQSRALELDAVALEDAVVAAGGCAAAVRTVGQWHAHPTGRAAGEDPLVAWEVHGADGFDGAGGADRAAAAENSRKLPALGDPARPAAGVRVLELTRVIAGPVAGRTLAALGADVLRVDPPALPEIEAQHLDSDPGKRSALLDLADTQRRDALLAGADVVLIGYRSGSLDRFDMRPEQLAARHPHLVQVWLSAWGANGPWVQRRGFDSLVQAASGIALECAGADGDADGDGPPGALPAQALDHATGHLLAAAALMGLARRERERGLPAPAARLSLARTAHELLSAPRTPGGPGELAGRADPDRHRASFGELSLIAPPGKLDGVPLSWPHGPRPFGGDLPRWGRRRAQRALSAL
jgi:CoA-transferase family III